jgi:hypothetical protein
MLTLPSTVTLSHEGAERRTSRFARPDANAAGLEVAPGLGLELGLPLGISLVEFAVGLASAATDAAVDETATAGLLEGSALALWRARSVASL